jgi:hypothetical protein
MTSPTLLMTVVELATFETTKKGLLTREEEWGVIAEIAERPTSGTLIPGTGGFRKLRYGTSNRGKSGSVRIIYYFHDDAMPLFLFAVFAKNEQSDLSQAEKNALKEKAKTLVKEYSSGKQGIRNTKRRSR